MHDKYINLEKEKINLKLKINNNSSDITRLEKCIREIKRKNSKLEVKISEINGEQIKIINGGKELPIFLDNAKGMV
ncbi:MAG: hypothetical protein RR795_02905 [Cetobacterium sp.]|uniref:hypothetical protein n=1 Tax=Cetobacterium sp. TaxID=2071632 RepID=UPI002FC80806